MSLCKVCFFVLSLLFPVFFNIAKKCRQIQGHEVQGQVGHSNVYNYFM